MNNTRNRSLAAIMFTDVVGFSAIMHKDESAAFKLLENHNKIVSTHIHYGDEEKGKEKNG